MQSRFYHLLGNCEIQGNISIQDPSNVGDVETGGSSKHEQRRPPQEVVHFNRKQDAVPEAHIKGCSTAGTRFVLQLWPT